MPDRSDQVFRKDETISFIEDMNEIILMVAEDRTIVASSDMAGRVLGSGAKTLVGLKIDQFIPKIYLNAIFTRVDKGEIKDMNLTFPLKNSQGKVLMLEARFNWTRRDGRELLSLICRDISGYLATIGKLTEKEERYRTLFHESPLGFIHVNSDGFVTDCNTVLLNIFHLFRDEVTGLCLAEQEEFGAYPLFARAAMEAVKGRSSQHETFFRSQDGQFEGWLRVTFSPVKSDNQVFLGAVGIVEDITESKQIAERVRFISSHDVLTKLYNRRSCEDAIADGLGKAGDLPLGVLYADLNGLKLANDAFGHAEGDQLLKATASILRDTGSPDDLLYRWGGDEFIILLRNSSEAEVRSRFEKIKNASRNWSGEGFVRPSLALGYALKSTDAEAVTDIIKIAEDAMYEDKLRNGRTARLRILGALEARMHNLHDCRVGIRGKRMLQWAVWAVDVFKMTEDEAHDFHLLCRYHDIGMLSSPGELAMIQREPADRESAVPLQHMAVGYRIARCIAEIAPIADVILAHHEWWNGKGYPNQLKGEAIPRSSRLVSIFDALEGMTSLRPKEERLSLEKALDAIEASSGRQFDPASVEEIVGRLRGKPPQFASDLEG